MMGPVLGTIGLAEPFPGKKVLFLRPNCGAVCMKKLTSQVQKVNSKKASIRGYLADFLLMYNSR
jgi:hypothetical protein